MFIRVWYTPTTQYHGVHTCVVHTNHIRSWCSYVCGTHQLHNIKVFIRVWYTPTTQYRGVHTCVVHTNHTISWCSYVCDTHQLRNFVVFIHVWYTPTTQYREHELCSAGILHWNLVIFEKTNNIPWKKNTQKI